jgi:hypothetical protein
MLYFIRFSFFFAYSFFLCLPTVMPVRSSGGDGSAVGPALGAEFLDDDELLNMWPHMDPNFISHLSTPNSWAPLLSHDLSAIDQVAPLSAHSSRVALELLFSRLVLLQQRLLMMCVQMPWLCPMYLFLGRCCQ